MKPVRLTTVLNDSLSMTVTESIKSTQLKYNMALRLLMMKVNDGVHDSCPTDHDYYNCDRHYNLKDKCFMCWDNHITQLVSGMDDDIQVHDSKCYEPFDREKYDHSYKVVMSEFKKMKVKP